jgi:(2R)-sulfolactate sulfo-lyase subunit alpha
VKLLNNVPLGHKVAMRELAKDKPVIKYGRPVGKAVLPIARGAHVHTHNVKTLRWSI